MSGLVFTELLGVGQGLLLLLAWLRSPNQRGWSGRFLTGLLVVASSLLGWMALHDSHRLVAVPDLTGLGSALPFLFGPLLYGYIKASVDLGFRWRRAYWLHLIPFGLVVLGHIPFFLQSFAQKQTFIASHYNKPHLDWWGQLPLVHFLLYWVPVFRLIKQRDAALKMYYSAVEAGRLAWLWQLVVGWVGCYGLFAAILYVRGLHPAGFVLAFSVTSLIYLIGYRQLHQPVLFTDEPWHEPAPVVELDSLGQPLPNEPSRPKYGKSPLAADKSRLYVGQLEHLMVEQARYLEGALTLKQVADELTVSPHTLSQVLNQTLGVSFYDYVNGYRVKAVKRALADPKQRHLTILALAFDAGFDSKAAFNNAFKKHTGLTPSQYRSQFHVD